MGKTPSSQRGAPATRKTVRKADDRSALRSATARTVEAPVLDYLPQRPNHFDPGIGLIGCGGIAESHLKAYRAAGYRVLALADLDLGRARARRDVFYPEADVLEDYHEMLARDDIQVVDIATHPLERLDIITDALTAKRHVLSQKPFVVDLDQGERLADLADKQGVRLAVNQNGRWAPYFSYMRQAVAAGHIGDPYAVHLACHWDHDFIHGTPFDGLHHVVLYDFAIHWFDMARCLLGSRAARSVSATLSSAPDQKARPPLLGQAIASFDHGQASFVFDACTRHGSLETACVVGTKGMLSSEGPVCGATAVRLTTTRGSGVAALKGSWFPDGFAGTMGELLCAIEEDRAPSNSARDNIQSLALCFAAVSSADSGRVEKVGRVRRLPQSRVTPQD